MAVSGVGALSNGRDIYGIFPLKGKLLNNQNYRIGIAFTSLKTNKIHFYEKEVISLEIHENRLKRNHNYGGQYPGTIRPELLWESQVLKN